MNKQKPGEVHHNKLAVLTIMNSTQPEIELLALPEPALAPSNCHRLQTTVILRGKRGPLLAVGMRDSRQSIAAKTDGRPEHQALNHVRAWEWRELLRSVQNGQRCPYCCTMSAI